MSDEPKSWTPELLATVANLMPSKVTRTPEGELVALVSVEEAIALGHRYPTMLHARAEELAAASAPPRTPTHDQAVEARHELNLRFPSLVGNTAAPKGETPEAKAQRERYPNTVFPRRTN